MRLGNKKIYHLEAWVVKVMSLYKVETDFLHPWRTLTSITASTLCTTLIWRTLSRCNYNIVSLVFSIISRGAFAAEHSHYSEPTNN